MIVYCVPDIDDTSPVNAAYVATLREAEAIAREESKADDWDDEFPPEGIKGRGSEKVVQKMRIRPLNKAGVLALLNHEGFALISETVAVFRNGRRVRL